MLSSVHSSIRIKEFESISTDALEHVIVSPTDKSEDMYDQTLAENFVYAVAPDRSQAYP